jgi:hypothetical protein
MTDITFQNAPTLFLVNDETTMNVTYESTPFSRLKRVNMVANGEKDSLWSSRRQLQQAIHPPTRMASCNPATIKDVSVTNQDDCVAFKLGCSNITISR